VFQVRIESLPVFFKIGPQKTEKRENKRVGFSHRRAEGFSWSMKVLHKGLKISFFYRKKTEWEFRYLFLEHWNLLHPEPIV
jgi:hypothetical protein